MRYIYIFLNFLCIQGLVRGDTADWMMEFGAQEPSRTLYSIAIPGSHDSATYKLSSDFGKNQDIPYELRYLKHGLAPVMKKWAKAQGANIAQQLENGVRYLDLRIIWNDSKKAFYSVHSLYGPPVDEIFEAISGFLESHPKEIIILHIGDLRYMPEGKHDLLAEKIKASFGEKIADLSNPQNVTFEKLWEENKQIIVVYQEDTTAGRYGFGYGYNISSPWPNKQDARSLKQDLDYRIQSRPYTAKDSIQFFVLQCLLTPDTSTIVNGLIPFSRNPHSLDDFAVKVNPHIASWLSEWKASGKINIVIADFMDQNIARAIIKLNEPTPAEEVDKGQEELESKGQGKLAPLGSPIDSEL